MTKVANLERPHPSKKCIEKYNKSDESYKCFLPEYLSEFVKIPTFFLHGAYDTWVGENIL